MSNVDPWLLAAFFFGVAFIYASVGLGGGSSYTALMVILGVSHALIPTVSLTLNLVATSVGSFNYLRYGHGRWRLIWPFFLTSIPMAYLGGSILLPKLVFQWLLLVSLLIVVLRIYLWDEVSLRLSLGKGGKLAASLLAGTLLGFVAGTVGIGGGIYLVPLILVLGLGTAKEAAATGALFVWVNSLSGLLARFAFQEISWKLLAPPVITVLIGAYLGSRMGAARLHPRTLEKILGAIILVAIGFLAHGLWMA